MTARQLFRKGDRVRSSPADPRKPRTGKVVGFGLSPWDIEVECGGRTVLTFAGWWEARPKVMTWRKAT